ncbi:RcnB family protein [Xanthomonas hortorum]|uniref:Nickel/cobalt homeostasis protein RcnB n=1 Tax=Xanthomonas hortorum pv. pelargonii TaxID=453602 RepID=A0A6V7DLJ1_9XANT|nr:RcnB family protein [Xanthomonas hortorum]MCE4354335.1 RcnB family protein [Xanthomonas hortorum pv. pelargonii]MCM5523998.1 RcnB family protein [Xanthomonas hortorum pv. pelargonii]MCM5537033.1 RcnB family protein [Xanthomonas hortorum pv. pelargonii]MCM5541128.1 RcnB family protein [Xanthomonas hortorum pv. pelargonii]MCM5544054.1 RcnB family protein [Xanthomonas hortorum pv. pelargonii]
MKRIIGSFMALSLLMSSAAFAAPQQHDDRDHENDRDRNAQRHDDHGNDRRDDKHDDNNRNDRRSSHNDDHRNDRRGPPYRRGERLAPDHRGNRVADYHKHHLNKPPRGHEWRQVDNNYVLIAVATGLIASVVAGR